MSVLEVREIESSKRAQRTIRLILTFDGRILVSYLQNCKCALDV